MVSADDRIHVDHKTQEGNKETTMKKPKNNVTKCGKLYGQNHLQSCPAKDKICSICAKRGHFAKLCRSTNANYLGDRHEEQQEEFETEIRETEIDPVAFAEFTSNNGWMGRLTKRQTFGYGNR